MDTIRRVAGLLGRGERAVADWRIQVEINGVPQVVVLPASLGVAWAMSPVGSEGFERAVAEVHRRIALIRAASQATAVEPGQLATA